MKISITKYIRYLPLLAPLPEGYAVFLAMDILKWHPIFKGISAVIVAGTGFWGVQVMNNMAEFNATLKKKEEAEFKRLPTWKAMLILAVWFTGVVLLTVFLDVSPILQNWAQIAIVVIGFSAAFLYNLSNLHETNVNEVAAYRQKEAKAREESATETKIRRKERQAHRQEIATKKQEISARLQDRGVVRKVKKGAKISDEMLLLEWTIDPTLSSGDMAKKLMQEGKVKKISRQAIDDRLKKMIENGLVIRTPDGQIVEVLPEPMEQSQGDI